MFWDKKNAEVNVDSVHSDDAGSRVLDTLKAVASHPLSINEVASEFTSEQKFYILKRLNYETLVSLEDLPISASYLLEKIAHLSVADAVQILEEFVVEHADDVNIDLNELHFAEKLLVAAPQGPLDAIDDALDEKKQISEKTKQDSAWRDAEHGKYDIFDWELQVKTEAGVIEFHSPYAEVRAVTDPYDDPEIYCETFRMYVVGLIWTAIGAFVNEFFYQRLPSISLTTSAIQILIYPTGMLLALILPKYRFKIGKWGFDLNPGPWNHKEQMLATLVFSVSSNTPYVSDNIPVMKMPMFYNVQWVTWGYQILLVWSTSFMGFGFAGIMRRFAVYPVKAYWPGLLPTLALNNALLKSEPKEIINGWKISRYNFFFITFVASFLYFWLPDYLFAALSTFNWMTWIAPNSNALAAITGGVSGLGLNPIASFDWNIISMNSPLALPFYSQFNQYIGSIIAFFCIVGVWYSNYMWTGYLTINSNGLFTNQGQPYDVTQILNENNLLDQTKYEAYGPPFYTAANLVVYGAFFAVYPFTIVYMGLTQWKPIASAFKGLGASLKDFKKSTYDGHHDAFSKSMRKYKEVPEWCFLIVLVISIVLAILCVKLYPMETPVWSIFFALAINFVFLIPFTLVYSITGFSLGLNVLVELIVGYALPGNGMALMFIKALGYNIDGQAQNYITDQKQAHYLRIPPRSLFRTQMISTFISTLVSLAVINFTMTHIKDYCLPHQAQKFTCPNANTYYASSVIWGVLGPKKVFSHLYPILKWCFLLGFLMAPVFVLVKKYFNKYSAVRYFEPVLIIGGFLVYAPYNLMYYTPGLIVSYFFMYVIRNNYLNWFKKYNYLLSSGLSAGVALGGIVIFFAVQYHAKNVSWWGNNVVYAGVDGGAGPAYLDPSTAPDGYFGPRQGNYP